MHCGHDIELSVSFMTDRGKAQTHCLHLDLSQHHEPPSFIDAWVTSFPYSRSHSLKLKAPCLKATVLKANSQAAEAAATACQRRGKRNRLNAAPERWQCCDWLLQHA